MGRVQLIDKKKNKKNNKKKQNPAKQTDTTSTTHPKNHTAFGAPLPWPSKSCLRSHLEIDLPPFAVPSTEDFQTDFRQFAVPWFTSRGDRPLLKVSLAIHASSTKKNKNPPHPPASATPPPEKSASGWLDALAIRPRPVTHVSR